MNYDCVWENKTKNKWCWLMGYGPSAIFLIKYHIWRILWTRTQNSIMNNNKNRPLDECWINANGVWYAKGLYVTDTKWRVEAKETTRITLTATSTSTHEYFIKWCNVLESFGLWFLLHLEKKKCDLWDKYIQEEIQWWHMALGELYIFFLEIHYSRWVR